VDYLTLIINILVGTGRFLITYSNHHTKYTHHQLKKFLNYF